MKNNFKQNFIEETYVKLLPTHDDAQLVIINEIKPGVPTDNEQLIREDLKFCFVHQNLEF